MLDYYLLLTSNSTFITEALYFGTIQICRNLNEHHYCLTSTKPNVFKENCQIDATCSPFQSLDMFPFQIRLACLKLTYHRLISNFSRYYFKTGTLPPFLIFACTYFFRIWEQLFWYPTLKNSKATWQSEKYANIPKM